MWRSGFIIGFLISGSAVAGPVDYLRDVKPLLAARCASCHGSLRQKSGLRLDTAALMLRGGKAGPAIMPGKSADSILIDAVTGNGRSRMPPKGDGEPLSDSEIAMLKAWIDQGAKAPEEPTPPDGRDHWAFRPVRSVIPVGKDHPVDGFLRAERDRRGLSERGPADRRTLIRRVFLDLLGLPPTPMEIDRFLTEERSDAYERLVDRLLADPRHGERWARHWMDVWRYADWDGYGNEIRQSQPHIWHWRDWIISSVNADKGYDQMIREMVAGDELAPGDDAVVAATGFLARNWYKFSRTVWLDLTIEHTSKAFLALTMNCAKCHDHMYDPISQREYYEFRAIFEPHDVRLDRVPGQPDPAKDGLPRVADVHLQTPTYRYERGDEARPDKTRSLAPGLPELFRAEWRVEAISLPPIAANPDRRDFIIRETIAASNEAVASAQRTLEAARREAIAIAAPQASGWSALGAAARVETAAARIKLASLDTELAQAKHAALLAVLRVEDLESRGLRSKPEWQLAATETVTAQKRVTLTQASRNLLAAQQALAKAAATVEQSAAKTKIMAAEAALSKAEAAMKAGPSTAYAPRSTKVFPSTSTGRRLALARWLTHRDNPLTARVAVNHIWMRHFGQPLVPSVFDFGRNGQAPSHPELLDWLAGEFMRSGWSMKHLHRLIVTSAAYRQSSSFDPTAQQKDPGNRWLWRFSPRRLEGETIRDSVLHLAGRLDLRAGGPEIDQKLGLTIPRRSIFFRHSIEKYVEMLKLFDSANVAECYRRNESIVPQQALALANNSLVLEQARRLAATLSRSQGAAPEFIRSAFETILGRPPTSNEMSECAKFLQEQTALLATGKLTPYTSGLACPVPPSPDPQQRAREDLIHVLFNHHEFVTMP